VQVPFVRLLKREPTGLPAREPCDFIAIDFETANETRASACAVGVAMFRGGDLIAEGSVLIDPETYFNPYNTMVNGISAKAVVGALTFADIWTGLAGLLDGNLVIAHNASFDMAVLRSSTARYEVGGGPTIEVACTYRLCKVVLPGLHSYSLGYLAPRFGISLEHHEAGEDARACGELANVLIREKGALGLREVMDQVGSRPGRLTPDSYIAYATPYASLTARDGDANADPAHPLFGKTVCFTGGMISMVRADAAAAVVQAGGNFRNSVSKELDYLVIGDADFVAFADGWKTGKLTKATALVEAGAPMEIIPERQFLELLYS
jgi:DNA polymerase-3 subunit epsilon